MADIGKFGFVNDSVKWGWSAEGGLGEFSIKVVRKDMEKSLMGSHQVWCFLWNNWAPRKVNYFGWRAELNRIPSKEELATCGVYFEALLCVNCGYMLESSNHLLVSCMFASNIWWQVCTWLNIPIPLNISSVRQMLEFGLSQDGSKEKKEGDYGCFYGNSLESLE
ncbi:uncharacterized protein LOC143576365 [Bidens hawaiensis]|uniref:uncharacterized protein LOC143576365 n=1 Tax=Bidens hawaiensis TaxID=980011 RepID=UPI00404A762E